MSHDVSSLAERSRDVLVRLTPEHPEAIDDLGALYATDVVFRDLIQEVRGLEPFLAVNRRLLARMRSLEWTVTSIQGDDREIFLEWTMREAAKFGPKMRIDGMTRARVRDGRIVDHRDYWDLGERMASSVPGGQRILHALLSPFA